VHPATVSLLCWFADCWLHCRFQQDTKLSHDCWDSSRSAKISDSGSSANTNGNPTYDFGIVETKPKNCKQFPQLSEFVSHGYDKLIHHIHIQSYYGRSIL